MNLITRLRTRARAAITVAVVAAGALVAMPAVAAAQDAAPVVVEGTDQLVIAPVQWTIITGLVLPVVIALIQKAGASEQLKHVLGIVTAAIAAIVARATLVDGSAVFTWALLLDVALVYVPQVLSYLNFWKPVVQVNQKLLPNVGIG